jgi:hypothetical protein
MAIILKGKPFSATQFTDGFLGYAREGRAEAG